MNTSSWNHHERTLPDLTEVEVDPFKGREVGVTKESRKEKPLGKHSGGKGQRNVLLVLMDSFKNQIYPSAMFAIYTSIKKDFV